MPCAGDGEAAPPRGRLRGAPPAPDVAKKKMPPPRPAERSDRAASRRRTEARREQAKKKKIEQGRSGKRALAASIAPRIEQACRCRR